MTEFVLRLHPQRRTVFAGILAYPLPSIPEAVETAGNFWDQAVSEKEAIFYAQTMDPAGTGNVCAFHQRPFGQLIP